MSTLEARGVQVHFEGIKAVDDVDMTLDSTEILGLIGPNGAGKTTLVNALSGFQRLTGGDIELDGANVTSLASHRRARRGLVRTFQNVRLFPFLSVLENVEAAAVSMGVRRREALTRAWEVLEVMQVDSKAHHRADSLSAGEERRVGIARALATRPTFVMLDEPAAGLNESESDDLTQALRTLRGSYGCGFLVIEHDMRVIMTLCDRVQVLDYGKTIAVGPPEEIKQSEAVLTAYLGARAVEGDRGSLA